MHRNRSNADRAFLPQQQPNQPDAQSYVTQHDFDGPAELTTTLVHAVSDVTGVDVTDTGFTLNDFVDPDALDSLFRPKPDGTPRGDGHVSFDVWGYQVFVYSSGRIVIAPPPQRAPSMQAPRPQNVSEQPRFEHRR